ncbi:hypothetical protein HK097_009532 [Rhizophlyctis rosea]|uniref:Uncharacterized protein n=1 Tax=Rhizophlyctis rosea TaxID=64517 RepID=A0AAD5SBJ8_9FUNG|nr:hypothetical protein HK097_009532 [Rhizophlyctis rosea]
MSYPQQTPLTQTLKLLDRLLTLLDTHASLYDTSIAYLDSITNLQGQRTDTRSFLPATDPSTLSFFNTTSPPPPVQNPQVWHNPRTTPDIVHAFPDLLSRLIAKQTKAMERALGNLQSTLTDMQKNLAALTALRRDAVAKAQQHSTSLTADSSSISPVEAADWIDSIVAGYEREMNVRQQLLKHLELGDVESNVAVGGEVSKGQGNGTARNDIETVRTRWALQSAVDLEKETEVRDRVKLMKMMGQYAG